MSDQGWSDQRWSDDGLSDERLAGAHVTLTHGASEAVIALAGAEAVRWRIGGQKLLWSADGAHWDRVAPVLFPVVGWCRNGEIRIGGRSYPMGVHGFAAQQVFEIIAQGSDHVSLRLKASPLTHAHYPFDFELDVHYRLDANRLETRLEVANAGAQDMPYACGLHPGFRWPFGDDAREGYSIEFAQPEAPEVPVIAPGGLFSREMRKTRLDGRRLALDDETFAQEASCFLNVGSRSVAMRSPGGAAIRVDFENFPHVALWSKPGAPFVCIETWTGHGDPVGFDGELADKPSMIVLKPGARGEHRALFEWVAPEPQFRA